MEQKCALCSILETSKFDMEKIEKIVKKTDWEDFCEECQERLCDIADTSSDNEDLTVEVLASLLSEED